MSSLCENLFHIPVVFFSVQLNYFKIAPKIRFCDLLKIRPIFGIFRNRNLRKIDNCSGKFYFQRFGNTVGTFGCYQEIISILRCWHKATFTQNNIYRWYRWKFNFIQAETEKMFGGYNYRGREIWVSFSGMIDASCQSLMRHHLHTLWNYAGHVVSWGHKPRDSAPSEV